MALLKTIIALIKRLFTRKPKPTKTVITRDEILAFVEETPHLRNSLKKSKQRRHEKEVSEARAEQKRKQKRKAQKNARKKQRR